MITATVPHAYDEAPRIKDSGERTEFETGAVRDCQTGKGRFDWMPMDVIGEYMGHFDMEEGFFYQIMNFKRFGNVAFLEKAIHVVSEDIDCFANSHDMLLQLAHHFEDGCNKYGLDNWKKGIPVSRYIDSACRHFCKQKCGWRDEPHNRACVWNLVCCIWTIKHMPEMDDYTDVKEKRNADA